MRYNDAIATEYGVSETRNTSTPVAYKTLPTKQDYKNGRVSRTFAKKVNEDYIIEIEYAGASSINQDLYKVVVIAWKISGPRNDTYSGEIMSDSGVESQNKFEIERVQKEEGVNLKKVLPNLLEYWQGH
jgi:hypothetical protein